MHYVSVFWCFFGISTFKHVQTSLYCMFHPVMNIANCITYRMLLFWSREARVRMVWWRRCSDDDVVGERDVWVFWWRGLTFSPPRNWRLEFCSFAHLSIWSGFTWSPCQESCLRSELAVYFVDLMNLSSGPPSLIYNNPIYMLSLLHVNKRRFSSRAAFRDFIHKAKPSWFTVYRPHPLVFLGIEQNFHNSVFLTW